MARPSFVKRGDKIGVVSTARKISMEEIEPAIKVLESWGLQAVVGKTVGLSHHQFAGTDEERVQDFQAMVDNPEVKAIICARGGYGTLRIVDDIDFRKFLKQPKWIAGFSDITVLNAHLQSVYDIPSIQAPMMIHFAKNTAESLDSLRKALFGIKLSYEVPAHSFNRNGECEGILAGGNLSLIVSLTGTSSDINMDGKILFIEDLDEYLYHIDRMMMHLKRAGKLENLAGLVVGGFTETKDNPIPFGKTAEEIIRDIVAEYEYPVCFGFPAGHIEDNRALIMGAKANLRVNEQSVSLSF